ncbi:predicted protein [Lichtheimia corymbifera JMRC:FSU:9682]|uniref:Secreted protein n=1 Tax=Lichtheimia corymbifera JMRC:FSU:9682 TaxID=1263082 RepID=A0A068RPN0_9FUNG|nr:predicted protein [Lichtheimia corymbifera JMRC:FSU:9682]
MRSIFATALAALACAASVVSADIVSQDGQYNITSPSDHGIFVAGQILPVTYRLGESSLDSLGLSIYLTSTSVANFTTQTIAAAADVSKSSPQTDNGVTFYEHSINYAIPSTTPAGSYNVVFESTNTNVNTTIPITMNAAVASSSSSASASATGSSGSSKSSSASSPKDESSASKQSTILLTTGAMASMALVVFNTF